MMGSNAKHSKGGPLKIVIYSHGFRVNRINLQPWLGLKIFKAFLPRHSNLLILTTERTEKMLDAKVQKVNFKTPIKCAEIAENWGATISILQLGPLTIFTKFGQNLPLLSSGINIAYVPGPVGCGGRLSLDRLIRHFDAVLMGDGVYIKAKTAHSMRIPYRSDLADCGVMQNHIAADSASAKEAMTIIYFGPPRKIRGIWSLLRAFEQFIAARRQTKLSLHLLLRIDSGIDESEALAIQRWVELRKFGDHIKLMKNPVGVDQLRMHLARARAIILPFQRFQSGFPIVIYEAVQLGQIAIVGGPRKYMQSEIVPHQNRATGIKEIVSKLKIIDDGGEQMQALVDGTMEMRESFAKINIGRESAIRNFIAKIEP